MLTNLLLYFVAKLNRYKDRNLSQKLFDMAEDYNTRPGTFNYFNKQIKMDKGEEIPFTSYNPTPPINRVNDTEKKISLCGYQ